jgi:uncharacterized glyoxalase superfamily protein PhnB
MKPAYFSHAGPFLPVKDLKETIQYYKEQLGFYEEWFWKDSDAGIRRDDLRLLFNKAPEFVADINSKNHALEICWFVRNVDAIYEEYKSKGLTITSPLQDQPWKMREFSIMDLNGYIIRIGEGIEDNQES